MHQYCSLRPLKYGMTTLDPSVNFPGDGFGFFCWFSVVVCLVEGTVLGSGCLVSLCECDPFHLQEIQV